MLSPGFLSALERELEEDRDFCPLLMAVSPVSVTVPGALLIYGLNR